MGFFEGLPLYTAATVTLIFIVLVTLAGLSYDAYKEHRKEATFPDQKEATEIEEKETTEKDSNVTAIVPRPSPAEQALLAANRRSLQMNMGALEAHRLLAEAARRHEYDPTPAAWYTDAEWNVQP